MATAATNCHCLPVVMKSFKYKYSASSGSSDIGGSIGCGGGENDLVLGAQEGK